MGIDGHCGKIINVQCQEMKPKPLTSQVSKSRGKLRSPFVMIRKPAWLRLPRNIGAEVNMKQRLGLCRGASG